MDRKTNVLRQKTGLLVEIVPSASYGARHWDVSTLGKGD